MLKVRTPTVALVGNPNTGKTTLFNALAGMNQRVGNYPGVTVESKKGKFRCGQQNFELVDLPGTYSLAPRSPDEMVAVNLILGHQGSEHRPDVVVTIVDASNLERNLYLMTQVMELGVPVVVALNMVDVARAQGITIDAGQLEKRLGVRVVPIQANKHRGLEELKQAVGEAIGSSPAPGPVFPEAFEKEVAALEEAVGPEVCPYLVRRLLLDVGGHTERLLRQQHGDRFAAQVQAARQRLADAGCAVPAIEAKVRYGWIRTTTAGCINRPLRRLVTWTDRLDRVLTHKIWGTAVFLGVMFLVFVSIFYWAQPFMGWIGDGQEWLGDWITQSIDPGPLRALLVDGVVKGVGGVLIFLPQIMILFAFIAVLEDCGYMARAAFLMDKLMARCGLNGKSFIPLLSSVACAVPGIMAARVIENRRDRFATILVAPLMSCSARLPVYMLLIGAFLSPAHGFAWWVPGLTLFAMYCVGLVVAPLVAWVLKSSLLRGETPIFVMEMPLYKIPSPVAMLRRTYDAGWMFIRRAGTLILASMIVVWALLYFPTTGPEGGSYDVVIAELEKTIQEPREQKQQLEAKIEAQKEELEALELADKQGRLSNAARLRELRTLLEPLLREIEALDRRIEPVEEEMNRLERDWKSQSVLGRMGRALEPVVRPLGWDWRIGMAALASFPAREVMVGTLGIIYNQGRVEADEIREAGLTGQTRLGERLRDEGFTVPVALSVMVFFALCCQCASTLAVIRRETNSWRWPAFTFVYMTALAYVGALVVFQVSRLLV